MEKKKLLFIMPHVKIGGADKALISLLSCVDFTKYSVDLMIFNLNKSSLINEIPKEVEIIKLEDLDDSCAITYMQDIKTAVRTLIHKKKINTLIKRLYLSITSKLLKRKYIDQEIWGNICKSISQIDKEYDVAIAYLNGLPLYFLCEKIKANKKICYIHFDYSNKYIGNESIERKFFSELDTIVCVSESVKQIFDNRFPYLTKKTIVIENIISPKLIIEKANDKSEIIKFSNCFKKKSNVIVTVGRLEEVKGIDIALDACTLLKEEHLDVIWFVIGSGKEYSRLRKTICERGLEDDFILVGESNNPYSWISIADIYVQPSRSEAKTIAIAEAKILQKPIVATKTSSISEQIDEGVNGYIVNISAQGIKEGIQSVIKNKLIVNNSSDYLNAEKPMQLFYNLFT